MFATMLNYKLAEPGDKLVYVHPAYTSQTCAECHVTDKATRIDQARFVCGREASADINGARSIHQARVLASAPPGRQEEASRGAPWEARSFRSGSMSG
jgi:putative transposase